MASEVCCLLELFSVRTRVVDKFHLQSTSSMILGQNAQWRQSCPKQALPATLSPQILFEVS